MALGQSGPGPELPLPIWWLAQAGLSPRRCWLVCGLWWLQPVVFNAALFDFHPETWVMPAFALALWAERSSRPGSGWLAAADAGLPRWPGADHSGHGHRPCLAPALAVGLAASGLSVGWLLMLSRWLYPLLGMGKAPRLHRGCSTI